MFKNKIIYLTFLSCISSSVFEGKKERCRIILDLKLKVVLRQNWNSMTKESEFEISWNRKGGIPEKERKNQIQITFIKCDRNWRVFQDFSHKINKCCCLYSFLSRFKYIAVFISQHIFLCRFRFIFAHLTGKKNFFFANLA